MTKTTSYEQKLSPAEVLKAMQGPQGLGNRVYILGCLQSPLTFHSQQQRAFNLIWALMKEKRLQKGDRLAIIGAGLAGVTCAAAALLQNLKVTLIDKNSEVLQLQNKNTTRFVHPNLYEWPIGADDLKKETDLPCLNWTAAYAGDVVAQVGRQWVEIQSQLRTASELAASGERDAPATAKAQGEDVLFARSEVPRKDDPLSAMLRVICNCEITKLELKLHGADVRISVRSKPVSAFARHGKHHEGDYDAVVVAVGFGIEKGLENKVPSNSYWMVDALEQVRPDRPRPFKVLVAGTGDGGLTDVLRLRIENFDHKTLHESLTDSLRISLDKFVSIDRAALEEKDKHKRQRLLHDRYWELKSHIDLNKNPFRLRNDTQVALMGEGPHPYDTSASTISRFALFLLLEVFNDTLLQYWPERITPDAIKRSGQWYSVHYRGEDIEFHDVVLRLGTTKVLPQLLAGHAFDFAVRTEFDHTRFRQYEPDFYSKEWKLLGREMVRRRPETQPNAPDLIGRRKLISHLVGLLQNQQNRLVTITGPPGQGKTALGLAALNVLGEKFEGDIVWVDLRSLSTIQQFAPMKIECLVLERIAQRAGIDYAPNDDTGWEEIFGTALRARRTILFLDGFDRMEDGASLFSSLLRRCARLQVVVTSKTALGSAEIEEHNLLVPELSYPGNFPADKQTARGEASEIETAAVQLFLKHARFLERGSFRDHDRLAHVRDLCSNFEGSPLAIVLTAARLEPDTDLADVIADFKSHSHRRPCYAALKLSHSKLHAETQTTLQILSIFPGGCRAEQANSVCQAVLKGSRNIRKHIASLAKAQLIQIEDDFDGAPRFRMSETVRAFAYSRLEASDHREEIWNAFSEAYADLAQNLEPKLRSGKRNSERCMERLAMEEDNLRAVLSWAAKTCSRDGRLAGLRLAGALFWFWNFKYKFSEAVNWLNLLLDNTSDLPRRPETAKAFYARAGLMMLRGDVRSGLKDIERSIDLWNGFIESNALNTECTRGLAYALIIRGMLRLHDEDEHSENDFGESRRLMTSIGDEWGEALASNDLARKKKGRDARDLFERSLAIWRTMGDQWGIALALHTWGTAEVGGKGTGCSPEMTFEMLDEARRIQHAQHDVAGEAATLARLGEAWKTCNDSVRAANYFRESLKMNIDIGRRKLIVDCLVGLADLAITGNKMPDAWFRLSAAEKIRSWGGAQPDEIERAVRKRVVAAVNTMSQKESAECELKWRQGKEVGANKALWPGLLA